MPKPFNEKQHSEKMNRCIFSEQSQFCNHGAGALLNWPADKLFQHGKKICPLFVVQVEVNNGFGVNDEMKRC